LRDLDLNLGSVRDAFPEDLMGKQIITNVELEATTIGVPLAAGELVPMFAKPTAIELAVPRVIAG